jgi:hypothetical protein
MVPYTSESLLSFSILQITLQSNLPHDKAAQEAEGPRRSAIQGPSRNRQEA